jgi:BlaI family transcriptional regulator, penicillinase repressor
MTQLPEPTERELQILKVLWDKGEATVREVYQALRDEVPIVQNTVQAFLRTMEQKGLVRHRNEGRSFVYRPVQQRERTSQKMVTGLLDAVFEGALDELVAHALAVRQPSTEELARLRRLLADAEAANKRKRGGS